MFQPVQQFHGFFFTAAADSTYFGCFLQGFPAAGAVLKSVFNVPVGDAETVAYFSGAFSQHARSACFGKVVVNGGAQGFVSKYGTVNFE